MIAPVEPWVGSVQEPRGWQREALVEQLACIRRGGRPLVSAATGTGKAKELAELVRCSLVGDGQIVVAVPSERLVKQLSETIAERVGSNLVGQFYGKRKAPNCRVVVACNPSLPALASQFVANSSRPLMLISDEAHRSETDSLLQFVDACDPRVIAGMTATPFRTDKRPLSIFSEVVYRYPMDRAIADGVLVPFAPAWWDGTGFDARDVDGIVESMIRDAQGPGFVTALTIKDAEAYAERLSANGFPSLAVHSMMPTAEVDARVARLLAGELRCLVQVSLLSEGIDIPPIAWIALRAVMGSPVRLLQLLGRALRTSPGKERAVFYDPNDLLGAIGLSHADSVGKQAAALEAAATGEARARGEGAPADRVAPAVAVSQLRQWARLGVLALAEAGFGKPDARPAAARAGWASPRMVGQVQHLAQACRWLPPEIRPVVEAAINKGDGLTVGEARDLIDLLGGLMIWREKAVQRTRWPAVDPALVEAARAA